MSFFCRARSAGVSSSRSCDLVARDHGFEIGRIAEEIRIDQGCCKRIGAAERDAAAALGAQQADVQGKAGARVALAAVIVGHRHAEMQLDVGHVEVRAGFQEAAAFGEVRCHRSAAFAPVLADRAQQPRNALQRQAVEVRIVRHVAEHEIGMVLQVLPDPGQMMPAFNAVLSECRRRRRRPTASAVAGSGTRRRRRSPRAARGSVSVSLPWRYSTPTARLPSNRMRVACAWVSTRKLARLPIWGWR